MYMQLHLAVLYGLSLGYLEDLSLNSNSCCHSLGSVNDL